MTARPGQLRESVTLQDFMTIDDGHGNEISDFFDVATVPARIQFLKGSEEVIAARLTGTQPIVITIRNGGPSAAVSTDWRVINDRTSETYNIRSIIRSERGDWIELLVESGVAT
ncbi:phage head closure protein [Mesorhizobium dulcispinae]|uniref:phage head closure protein n=1 Tax=Mesorhizobium dulcispinae TaxID=3072316 RepID=UPI002A23E543|nr:phage head closure protein [Mesorhizobium sp. VK23D]MDX8517968.1 phage head closure protein [Mesorhizobium sp. VK23D]